MDSIQNELVKRFAKNKLQELMGGGQASSKHDAQSMVIDMVKSQFGLGHDDAKKVTHEMTGPAEEESGGFGGMMGKAANFLGGGDEKHQMQGGAGYGNQMGGESYGQGGFGGGGYGGGQQGGDMMGQAERLAMQALGGGQGGNQVVGMLMDKFGLDHGSAREVVNRQQGNMDGAAGGGSGAMGGFAEKAEGFLERMTGQ